MKPARAALGEQTSTAARQVRRTCRWRTAKLAATRRDYTHNVCIPACLN